VKSAINQPKTQKIKDFSSHFEYISPIAVQESKTGKAIIEGTLITEGISKNGHWYTIETLEQLDNLSDIPIYVGTDSRNKHTKSSGVIGKIIKTTFDKIARKVRFVAEIFNKSIAESVRSGWGISIGGKAKGQFILDKLGRIVTLVSKLVLNHVQLLMPTTQRGVPDAQVESVQIQESMIFRDMPKLSRTQIAKIISALVAEGEI
jgi:hypothetical protein